MHETLKTHIEKVKRRQGGIQTDLRRMERAIKLLADEWEANEVYLREVEKDG